jgi:alpha/beta superfamily hydrolase
VSIRNRVRFRVGEAVELEGELVVPEGARDAVVLCHPHPLYGGTMRSIVISTLFAALPPAGVACLRFNFRGVEGSSGVHDDGQGERDDVVAALDVLDGTVPAATPITLCGWSFGARIALQVVSPRIAGWIAIAPPTVFVRGRPAAADDPRSKLLVLAERDEYGPLDEVRAEIADWVATTHVVVPGADHFFVGRTDRVAEIVQEHLSVLRG